jgi:hypothetical protein
MQDNDGIGWMIKTWDGDKNGPDDATGIVWAIRYVFFYLYLYVLLTKISTRCGTTMTKTTTTTCHHHHPLTTPTSTPPLLVSTTTTTPSTTLPPVSTTSTTRFTPTLPTIESQHRLTKANKGLQQPTQHDGGPMQPPTSHDDSLVYVLYLFFHLHHQ